DRIGQQRDRAAADRDLAADRRDEVAALAETTLRHGALVPAAAVAAARQAAASDRSRAARDRGAGADERTLAEVDRDTASSDRGAGASERTSAGTERESAYADRLAGAGERTRAEGDRIVALADRGAGAGERWRAEQDRTVALADRFASARERQEATVDGLTGVLRRDVGFGELEREIARSRRTGQPLVVAFVDVDHLKSINDTFGHLAGDRLLVQVAGRLAAALRPYDVVLRYGGDEFVCGLPGADLATATARLGLINPALAAALEPGSVTVGLAELQPGDTLDAVIARADEALYARRRLVRGPGMTKGPPGAPDEPLAG
ncbi:MAG TPA: GGDEF domain-containing protein, partial [Actinomycetales bacterium]